MRSVKQAVPRTAAAGVDRRERLCPAGQVANSYLDRATDTRDRARRSRRMAAWAARRLFGISLDDVALAFGVTKQFISQETAGLRDELRLEAARLNLAEEAASLDERPDAD